MKLTNLLNRLEKFYGKTKIPALTDPYFMILWRNCGYPQSDANCDKGFAALKAQIGLHPEKIFHADDEQLRAALKVGGMVPEKRAMRLKEIAASILGEHEGDRHFVLRMSHSDALKALKKYPTIGDSFAEKILLYAGIAPTAAVPVNAVHVLARLGVSHEYKNWGATYKSAQEAIRAELPEEIKPQMRAYLLLKEHAQTLCKANKPNCDECPLTADCLYYKKGLPRAEKPKAKPKARPKVIRVRGKIIRDPD